MSLAFSNKKILLRVDYNVPFNSKNEIEDDTRIRASLPTIEHLLNRNNAIIILSHLGRPQKDKAADGSIKTEKYSLKKLLPTLSKLLGISVKFGGDLIGPESKRLASELKAGEVLLLENTRWYPAEESGDPSFAAELANMADVFVNDAFGTAHRAHASTSIVADYFARKDKAFGLLMQKEIRMADRILYRHAHPFVGILGGSKVSDKIGLIKALIPMIDSFLIGGAMAFSFLRAKGLSVGKSKVEEDKLDLALELLDLADRSNTKILLPTDVVAADRFAPDAKTLICPIDKIPLNDMGLDIGPKTIKEYTKAIEDAKTILWNGPMGVFEMDIFANGTNEIAKAVAKRSTQSAFSLVGGGDSVAALKKTGLDKSVGFVSTGGGAMLRYLESKVLPGITAITEDKSMF